MAGAGEGPSERPEREHLALDSVAEQRVLRLIGLGIRGRGAVVGVQQVREAVLKDRVALAIVARDASPNSRAKVVPLLAGRHVPYVEDFSAVTLGQAAGRESVTAIGIVDVELAKGIRGALRKDGRTV